MFCRGPGAAEKNVAKRGAALLCGPGHNLKPFERFFLTDEIVE